MADSTLLGDWTEQYAGRPLNLAGYHLNFDTGFDTLSVGASAASPDASSWFAPVRPTFGAAAFQGPTAAVSPFSVSGGALTIEMSQVGGQWQTGYMQTLNSAGQGFQQQYGYFEMSAKFPAGAGSWPAFWLLSADPTKPRIEIDVVEAYGDNDLDGHHAAIHVTPAAGSDLTQKVDNSEYTQVGGSMFDGQFHTYGAMVTPDWIIIYYDRAELTRFPAGDYFKTPVYMVVDLALNGSEAARAAGTYDMVVDYVRAYGDPALTAIVDNGSLGDDSLTGTAFNDTLGGAGGVDTLSGRAGDDIYYVDNSAAKVVEAANGGADTVNSSVSFSLAGQYIETLRLTGAAAIDAVGNSLANQLFGASGANILDGGAGADTLAGGAGDDSYRVDNAGDRVIEATSAGVDTVEASVSFSLVGQYVENLRLTGAANLDATGNSLANQLFGNGGANVLNGREGADTMTGGAGDDTYYLDNSGDQVVELANGGRDTIVAAFNYNLASLPDVENLTLTGSSIVNGYGNGLNNLMTGNSGINRLEGGTGGDTLDGGLGADVLLGGQGRDVFLFDTALGGANVDQLGDFLAADDKLYLKQDIFTGLAKGALPAGAFVIGARALQADDHIVYDSATGELFYDPDGSGAAAQVKFAQLAAGNLSAANFVVV
jgi:Ca2+-binding RTX toxin-like protein